MKRVTSIVGFCLFLTHLVTASNNGWEIGKQYNYKVCERALTGIAEIGNEYNGLQLEYNQIIMPKSDGRVNVKIENLKVIEVNEQLEEGWMHSELKQGQQTSIPSEVKQYLTSPMELTFKKGVVQSIKVQGDLPTWAVNIKKAMASVWTLDTVGSNIVIEGSLNGPKAKEEFGSGSFFKTLEETVHGKCEAYFTVSPYGQFPILKDSGDSSSSSESRGNPWPLTFSQLCQNGDQIYETVKTVNFTACTEKPVLAYSSPSALNFNAGDNGGGSLWQHTLVSRYLTCGPSSRSNKILKVTQHEQFYSGLGELEKVFAGAQKNVTLASIRTGNGPAAQIQKPKTIVNLAYTYDPIEQDVYESSQLDQVDPASNPTDLSARAIHIRVDSSNPSMRFKIQKNYAFLRQEQEEHPTEPNEAHTIQRQLVYADPEDVYNFCVTMENVSRCEEGYESKQTVRVPMSVVCMKSGTEESAVILYKIEVEGFYKFTESPTKTFNVPISQQCHKSDPSDPSIIYRQTSMVDPIDKDNDCFSVNELGWCAPGFKHQIMIIFPSYFICMQKDLELAKRIRKEIDDGILHKFMFDDENIVHELNVFAIPVPEQCLPG